MKFQITMSQDQIKSQELIEKDVLTRLQEELKELNDKLYKLHDVLYTNKKIVTVRPVQAILMEKQYNAMYEYREILMQRISNISVFLEIDDDNIGKERLCDEDRR